MSAPNSPVVQFPKKMEVESPKTDNLISSLTIAFSKLSEMLQESFKEIAVSLRTLRVLPDMLTKFQENVAAQFSNLFAHQLEAQVVQRHANAEVARKKLEAVAGFEKEKLAQLDPDVRRVDQRYAKLLDEVAADCGARIRRLDSHAFEIVDAIYPKQVQEKFSFDSLPALRVLADHATEAALERTAKLDEGLQSATASIMSFLGRRESFYERLSAEAGAAPREAGVCEIPVLMVETRNVKTGEKSLQILLAGEQATEMPPVLAALLDVPLKAMVAGCSRVRIPRAEQQAMGAEMVATGRVPEGELGRFLAAEIELIQFRQEVA